MVKVFAMKKFLVLSLIFACFAGKAQTTNDPVVMTVNGKQIPLSEFVFIAEKNGEVDLTNSKSVKSYVELFKNFKLKVAEAEARGLDKTKSFTEELDGYRTQLVSSYLSNKNAEEAAARVVYDRSSEMLELSHILFRLPEQTVSKDTLAVYQQAMQAYERINKGADFAVVGKELTAANQDQVAYEYINCLLPMQAVKAFEEAVYAMPEGTLSKPIRTKMGFHVIKLHSRKPNPGIFKVAHILIAFPKDSVLSAAEAETETLARAEEVYKKLQAGGDFAELAKEYSADGSAKNGGQLPPFGPGEMVKPFEEGAFALTTPGELSGLVKSRFGYHIIKLIEKKGIPSFEDSQKALLSQMGQGERNFELHKVFEDQMKKEHGYVFYPEAYAELQQLCNDYFPTDPLFYEKARDMKKTLVRIDTTDFPQNEFAYYIQRCPFSTKTYSVDFMQEVYDLFIRDIITRYEHNSLETKHPEFNHLMQEYRDGILLFEVSNREIWSKPAAQQPALEKAWLKELNDKYSVEINWKLLKKIKK
ncbi:MAG: peptidylprolyl isomerase [Tannerellaceae bacterium]